MKKALLIIAHEGFNDTELLVTQQTLIEKGFTTTIASTSLTFAEGMNGTKIKPDMDLEEAAINLPNYSAVVFIGGKGATRYFSDAICHNIAKSAFENGKVVAAICIAPVILAKAGILNGFSATVFTTMFDKHYADVLRMEGARYHDKDVVADRNIVTASGPKAAKKFAEQIAKLVS